jgi:hypothetical protein
MTPGVDANAGMYLENKKIVRDTRNAYAAPKRDRHSAV